MSKIGNEQFYTIYCTLSSYKAYNANSIIIFLFIVMANQAKNITDITNHKSSFLDVKSE